jgi:hypothetical protein
MPYYVYRIHAERQLEYVDNRTRYQEAKALVRALRAEHNSQDPAGVRLVFAKSTGEAEQLLSLPRDDRVIGED